jgi:hypothetical protein
MIVDQQFVAIGSANFVDISFQKDHTELNVSSWDESFANTLLYQLLREHLGFDLSSMVNFCIQR